MANRRTFTFKILLSIPEHLGRNLYRSFATVLGEAILNAWDADANNVQDWFVQQLLNLREVFGSRLTVATNMAYGPEK